MTTRSRGSKNEDNEALAKQFIGALQRQKTFLVQNHVCRNVVNLTPKHDIEPSILPFFLIMCGEKCADVHLKYCIKENGITMFEGGSIFSPTKLGVNRAYPLDNLVLRKEMDPPDENRAGRGEIGAR